MFAFLGTVKQSIYVIAACGRRSFNGRVIFLMTFIGAFVLFAASSRATTSRTFTPATCAIPGFTGPTKVSANSPSAMVIDDFNKDGKPDIATANAVTGVVSVFLGNGTGSFSPPTNFVGGSNATFLAAGDLNGDGNADLVIANGSTAQGELAILLGNGAGGFGSRTQVFIINGTPDPITAVAIGDVNGDGNADVALTSSTFNSVTVMLGDGTGKLPSHKSFSTGGQSPSYLLLRDVNGDGKADLVITNVAAGTQHPGTVATLLGDGAGNFSAPTIVAVGGSPVSIASGDFNGDGKLDLAVANNGSGNISVLLGDGAGSFGAATNYAAGNASPQSIVAADFSGDGKLDLAVWNQFPGSVMVFLGDGGGGFNATADFSDGGGGSGRGGLAAVGDLNGDGRLDLIVANVSAGSVAILLNSCGAATASQVQLLSSFFDVFESDVIVTVYVTRLGDITGTASADYATSDGTATAPQDYTAASGTLTFAPGETFKTFTIPIVNDSIPEPQEKFSLTLSNVTGNSSLGSPATASILIEDDDTAIVQFSSSSFVASESSASASVNVSRTGSSANAVNVDYATSDTSGENGCSLVTGVASSRCDYITTIGTLHFASGETFKTIAVPIVNDSYAEGPEIFTVTLSNPTGLGVILGANTIATVTINDNETANGSNPVDTSAFFVREHYVDFLNRQPDQSGLDFWTNQITSCGSDQACIDLKRINVSAAFYISIEFQDTGYLVERIYKAAYGDASGTSTFNGTHQLAVPIIRLNEFLPDTQEIGQGVIVGQGNWQQQLETNKQAFTAEFVLRSRFTTAFPGSMTAAQFVDKLNTNAGSPLSQSERDQLVSDLSTNAKTRAQVLRAVAEDQDLNNAEFNRAFVLMQYFGYLRRNPNDPQDTDYTGFDFWLTKLNQFNGNFVTAEMVKAFITSGEYRQRFGP